MQNQSAIHARQTGGFNQTFGNFSDEHLFEQENLNKLDHAVATAQDAKPELPQSPESPGAHPLATQVDTLKELPHQLGQNFIDLLNPLTWFGVTADALSPEQKVRMAEIHRRFQTISAQDQQVALQKLQERESRKKRQEEEELQRKEAQQQSQQQFSVPSGKHTGAPGGQQRLQDQRTKQGNAGPSDVG